MPAVANWCVNGGVALVFVAPRVQFQKWVPVTVEVSMIGFFSQSVSPMILKEATGLAIITDRFMKAVSLAQPAA